MKPKLIVMCGLQCSGKSTRAKELAEEYDAVVLSSDEIRTHFPEANNDYIFKYLYEQMNALLKESKNVLIDATNVTIKSRRHIFQNLKVECCKICYIMNTPYSECVGRLQVRNSELYCTHYVPNEVLEKYHKSFEIPFYEEGWDEIVLHSEISLEKAHKTLFNVLGRSLGFNQQNMHHTQDLGTHMATTQKYLRDHYSDVISDTLEIASGLHDVGKLFTQTFKENDVNAHYYNHANIGAYYLMCEWALWDRYDLCDGRNTCNYNVNKTLEILFYINYHMHMYNIKTEKSVKKWKDIFSEEKFNDLLLLNEADRTNHSNEN